MLYIFGGERKKRLRYALAFEKKLDFLPIGTMLQNLGKLADNRRRYALLQLQRRAVALHLDAGETDREEVIRKIMEKEQRVYSSKTEFTKEERELLGELTALEIVCNKIKEHMRKNNIDYKYKDEDKQKIFEFLLEKIRYFQIPNFEGEWEDELAKLILRLARGRALCHGRIEITFDDVKRVTDILEQHAKELNYWKEPEQIQAKLFAYPIEETEDPFSWMKRFLELNPDIERWEFVDEVKKHFPDLTTDEIEEFYNEEKP